MPKTQTKRGLSPRELDALRKQYSAEQKQRESENKWQLANDIVSGINDILGRGVVAPILGIPGDINQAIWDAGAWVNNNIKDVEVATGMVKQPKYVPYSQGNARLGSEGIGNMMEQAGLVSSERRPLTELTASMISPGAAAKSVLNAPKTAMNALRMVERLDEPVSRWVRLSDGRLVPRNQLGAITVWHGSPNEFDQFKAMGNIGKGEGAQAYGHGGYHAGNPSIALHYKNALSPRSTTVDGKKIADDGTAFTASGLLNSHRGDVDGAINSAQSRVDWYKARIDKFRAQGASDDVIQSNLDGLAKADQTLSELSGMRGADISHGVDGYLYRNELRWPDPAREASDPLSDKHFLDWDKPLSEQKDVIGSITPESMGLQYRQLDNGKHAYVNADGGVVGSIQSGGSPESFRENWTRQLIRETDTGADFYKNLSSGLFSGDKGSVALRQAGIPGIRYLDAGSRPTNVVDKELYALYEKYGDVEKAVDEMMKGVYNTPKVKQQMREGYIKQLNERKQTHNYVTFSDDLVNILERNGVPVTAPQPGFKKKRK